MSNSGKYGERFFKYIMGGRGYKVEDTTNNPYYWEKDIDFVITSSTTGTTKSFEVKWDSRINQTGNLYLELTNAHSKGGQGWYKFCQADYLAYGDAAKRVFYIIPLQLLRERVKELPQKVTHCGADSTGLLINLKDIADLYKIL